MDKLKLHAGLPRNFVSKLTEGLTPDQKAAVSEIDHNLEIVACAGAGKTKTITLRIMNLLAHGVAPESIVAITFTEKAAAEMKNRIYAAAEKYLGNTEGLAAIFIGTIDSFCLNILQDYVEEFAKFSVLDEVQLKVFLEKFQNCPNRENPQGGSIDNTGLRGSVIDRAYNLRDKTGKKLSHYVSLMSLLNNCWFDKKKRRNWNEDTLQRLSKYNRCLYEHKFFDFSSLIRETIERLDPDSDTNHGHMSKFGEQVFGRVKYLTIDEYQDSNPPQEHLANLFCQYAGANLCVVGDPDQTIYQFRGSCESNILDFAKKYGARKITLSKNFRSTKGVIDIASKAIAGNYGKGEGCQIEPGEIPGRVLEYEDGDIVWKAFPGYGGETSFIADRIRTLHDAGVPYREMAVLFRRRLDYGFNECHDFVEMNLQGQLVEKLKEAGIPYTVEGLNGLSETSEYIAAKDLFIFIYDQCIPEEWHRGHRLLFFVVTEEKLQESWQKIGEEYGDPHLVDGYQEAIEEVKAIDFGSLRYGHDCNLQTIFQDFISHMQFIDSKSEAAERIMYNLGKFSRVIADFELLYFQDSPQFKIRQFKEHLEKVADGLYAEGMEDNAYIKGDAVRLMTVHQSKGLEFTAVFLPAMCNGLFPIAPFSASSGKVYGPMDAIRWMSNENGRNWITNYDGYATTNESERKLFYVAVTRSKKYLFFTYGNWYDTGAKAESPFLGEVRDVVGHSYLKEYVDCSSYSAEHLPEMKEEPNPIVLNFSLLSNYYDCPYRFKLSTFYGFVQPYTSMQGYGKMLHEIMMHIHDAWLEGRKLTAKEIDRITEDALYLPFASSAQLQKTLEGAKKCARAYVTQNKADADKLVASEMEINLAFGEGVSVNGRIDLVKKIEEDGKDKIAIVDLKSAGKDAEQCLNAQQLKIYALGYRAMTGTVPDYLMIYNLDAPDGSKNAQEEVREDVLRQVEITVLDAARNIRDSNLPKCVGENCEKCFVKELCKKKN